MTERVAVAPKQMILKVQVVECAGPYGNRYIDGYAKLQKMLDDGWNIARVDKLNFYRANDCLIYVLEKWEDRE